MTFTLNERLKQFLLSLLNATLLLGIVFAIAGIILIARAQSFAASVVSTVNFAVLESIDKDVKDVAVAIDTAERDLKAIARRLRDLAEQPEIVLSADLRQELGLLHNELRSLQATASALPDKTAQDLSRRLRHAIGQSALSLGPTTKRELRQLNRGLSSMQRSLAALTSSHARVSDHAIRTIAQAAANAYIGARRCRVTREVAHERAMEP